MVKDLSNVLENIGEVVVNTTTHFFDNFQTYRVLAIIGIFITFFLIVTLLNYFQKKTVESFININTFTQ